MRGLLPNVEIRYPGAPDGFVPIGHYFQAFAPAAFPFPEELVQAIRHDLDPEICPMWCNNVYQNTAGGIIKLGRYWLWREVRDPLQATKTPRFIPDTYGLNAGRMPNTPLLPLEADRTPFEEENNLAGGFLPFDDWVYDLLRDARNAYEPDYDKEADSREKAAAAKKAAVEERMQEKVSHQLDDNWSDINRNIEKLTAQEKRLIRDYGLFGVPIERPKKPTVDLHTGA